MTLYPSYLLVSSKRYRLESMQVAPRFRFAWDDELEEYGYQSRTAASSWDGLPSTPAVLRFYPIMRDKAGDFRVNIEAWEQFILDLNGGDTQKFDYWTAPGRAQFNNTGWPMLMYVGMSGNQLQGERVGDWFRFETLKPDELSRARGMTSESHPQFIHHFTCIAWRNNGTVRIDSTGTPRGSLYYPLITNEGYAYILWKYVKEMSC